MRGRGDPNPQHQSAIGVPLPRVMFVVVAVVPVFMIPIVVRLELMTAVMAVHLLGVDATCADQEGGDGDGEMGHSVFHFRLREWGREDGSSERSQEIWNRLDAFLGHLLCQDIIPLH